jgi:hypothetical protein
MAIFAGPIGMAATFGISEVATNILQTRYLRQYVPDFELRAFGSAIIRPGLSSIAMVGAVVALGESGFHSPMVSLLVQIIGGAAIYVLALFLLWRAAGQPRGPESIVLSHMQTAWRVVYPY